MTNRKTRNVFAIGVLGAFLICSCASTGPARDVAPLPDAAAAFTVLKSLVGTWKKDGPSGGRFRIQFSLTANASVVVESWMKGDEVHSLTLYHRDGDALLATHYCPQGNQPRLALVQFLETDREQRVAFAFRDATNLSSARQSRQTAVRFDVSKSGSMMTRSETYADASADQRETSSLTLSRSVTAVPVRAPEAAETD